MRQEECSVSDFWRSVGNHYFYGIPSLLHLPLFRCKRQGLRAMGKPSLGETAGVDDDAPHRTACPEAPDKGA